MFVLAKGASEMRFPAVLLACIVSAFAVAADVGASSVQPACPTDEPSVRNHLKSILHNTRVRTQMEIAHVNPENLRLLAEPGDTQICQAIMAKVKGTPVNPNYTLKYVFYTADGYYFSVIVAQTQTGELAYAPGELIVFDSALNEVHGSIF